MNWRSLQPVERSASALDVSGQFTVHHASLPFIPVATQKAKGVLVLQAAGFKVPSTTIARSEVQLAYAVADKLRQSSYAFLRGCPKKPRHGFVDSKLVNNVQDAKKLWDEVRDADPEGEMLVCHYVQSEYNAIWTPTGLTVGKGNDGATGGKGERKNEHRKEKEIPVPHFAPPPAFRSASAENFPDVSANPLAAS